MPSRRARRLAGVLHNFLETYTSRYTQRNGYWLFGFIVDQLDRREIDLLANQSADDVAHLARTRFRDQLAKNRGIETPHQATLILTREAPAERKVDGVLRAGYTIRLTAQVRAGNDIAERSKTIFVATHDSRLERPAARPDSDAKPTNPQTGAPFNGDTQTPR